MEDPVLELRHFPRQDAAFLQTSLYPGISHRDVRKGVPAAFAARLRIEVKRRISVEQYMRIAA